jgi:hypothetical protein
VFRRTREAYLERENAKAELKGLMPEDAKEAIGHGIRAKRSKSASFRRRRVRTSVDRDRQPRQLLTVLTPRGRLPDGSIPLHRDRARA